MKLEILKKFEFSRAFLERVSAFILVARYTEKKSKQVFQFRFGITQ